MMTVDKGIPMPSPSGGGARKYPWREMGIGDSFLINGRAVPKCAGLSSAARRHGIKIAMRTVRDGNGDLIGTRVWRIE